MTAWSNGQEFDLSGVIADLAVRAGFDLARAEPMTSAEEAEAAERERERATREAWVRRRAAELELAGVDEKHARIIVTGQVADGPVVAKALEWADSDATLLVLSGPKGRGKSLAAGMLVHRFGGVAVEASLICDDGWWMAEGRRSRVSGLTREDLANAPLLVIDDFGQESAGRREHVVDVLAQLVQLRTRKGLRTIITTNLLSREAAHALAEARKKAGAPADEVAAVRASTFRAYLGHRAELVTARIVEHGLWVDCLGADLRTEEARRRRGGGTP